MKESYFIGVSEVKEIVGCSKSRAYQFIQQMNKELEAKGLLTFPGRVPRRYRKHRRGVRFPTERNAAPDSDDSRAS